MALSITRSFIALGLLAGGVTGATFALIGCATAGGPTTPGAPGATTAPAFAPFGPSLASRSGGAQLWSQTCGRCHNLRSPSSYSPAQWEVAVHDMRVRANLTGEEERKITEFLKSASR